VPPFSALRSPRCPLHDTVSQMDGHIASDLQPLLLGFYSRESLSQYAAPARPISLHSWEVRSFSEPAVARCLSHNSLASCRPLRRGSSATMALSQKEVRAQSLTGTVSASAARRTAASLSLPLRGARLPESLTLPVCPCSSPAPGGHTNDARRSVPPGHQVRARQAQRREPHTAPHSGRLQGLGLLPGRDPSLQPRRRAHPA
jgi:hypothetical protein